MKKPLLIRIIIGVIILALLLIVLQNNQTYEINDSEEVLTLCSPESRGPNLYCIQVYEPVCGSDNKTYLNSCTSCLNSSVEHYVEGECQ